MQNSGCIPAGKVQILRDGVSDSKNNAVMKILNLISIGERAGSGVPNIYSVWTSQGWDEPIVEEQFNPDRTILTLTFTENQRESKRKASGKTSGKTSGKFKGNYI